jgi:hypothetical protein
MFTLLCFSMCCCFSFVFFCALYFCAFPCVCRGAQRLTHTLSHSSFHFLFSFLGESEEIFKIDILHKIQSPFIHSLHLTAPHSALAHSKSVFIVDCRSSIGGGEERKIPSSRANSLRAGQVPYGGTGGR